MPQRDPRADGSREDTRATLLSVNLDASSLIAGFVVSGVGFVLFSYGRKLSRIPQMCGGLILMVFPYFVPSVPWMLAIAGLLSTLIWVGVKMGF